MVKKKKESVMFFSFSVFFLPLQLAIGKINQRSVIKVIDPHLSKKIIEIYGGEYTDKRSVRIGLACLVYRPT